MHFARSTSPSTTGVCSDSNRCLRSKRPSVPYEFIGLGALDFAKPNECLGFGELVTPLAPNPPIVMKFRWVFIVQAPAPRAFPKRGGNLGAFFTLRTRVLTWTP